MKDQVDNLKQRINSDAVAAIYGMLTPIERGEILEQIRLGEIGLLYISPEQLRNHSVIRAIQYRETGCWVFDEAHCLSKWGHDFRPDYLYAARFIKEFSLKNKQAIPPVACYTATAKKDVIDEIIDHFKEKLHQELNLFEGGIERDNLLFEVQTVNAHEKYTRIHDLLEEYIGNPSKGSAIIYCSKQSTTEETAKAIAANGWIVEAFHGGLKSPEKRSIQDAFIRGDIPVITATNAFGMGIDKENVRLVIHADIPGSLENYLQEAGRAGRDRKEAKCILLFEENDIEIQFGLNARSALSIRDISQILRSLKSARHNDEGEVIITAGELLRSEYAAPSFDGTDNMADTKVKTAVSWLERAGFVERNDNRTSVFQGRPKLTSAEETSKKLSRLNLPYKTRQIWETILTLLINTDPDDGMSTDDIAEALGKTGLPMPGKPWTPEPFFLSFIRWRKQGLSSRES